MTDERWSGIIGTLLAGSDLSQVEAADVMHAMMEGQLDEIRAGAFLTAMAAKGLVVWELVGLAGVMREKMLAVDVGDTVVLDTCGTGGSGFDTPNVSTMAAFVVAASGVPVAKHGNRASSGRCGSSDLLEALGVPVSVGPKIAARLIEEVGLAFLFAPRYHPAMKFVVPVRRRLGFRTVFNFLGPLCNPAGARLQLLGVSDARYAPTMAAALAALGSERVLVVHGEDGLDEVTLSGATRTWLVADGQVREGRFEPQEAGFEPTPFSAFCGGDVAENVRIFERVMAGEPGPHADLVALNAGAALWLAGRAEDLASGAQMAKSLLMSGAALGAFERYKEASLAAQ